MLHKDILTLSFAARDSQEAQIQLALERGIPAFCGFARDLQTRFACPVI